MPAQVSVFIATSLDGFIARPDGAIDWLNDANRRVPAGEDCGYQYRFGGQKSAYPTKEKSFTTHRHVGLQPVTPPESTQNRCGFR